MSELMRAVVCSAPGPATNLTVRYSGEASDRPPEVLQGFLEGDAA